jgi:hypothetical protein
MVDRELHNGPHDNASKVDILVMTKAEAVNFVNTLGAEDNLRQKDLGLDSKIVNELGTREGRKQILDRMGINASTTDDYRLVIYKDGAQQVAMTGHYKDDSKAIVADKKLSAVNGVGMDAIFRLINDLLGGYGSTKPLIQGIVIPAGKGTEGPGDSDLGGHTIKLPPKQAERIQSDMTLMVLADKAGKVVLASDDANARLPAAKRGDRNPVLGA